MHEEAVGFDEDEGVPVPAGESVPAGWLLEGVLLEAAGSDGDPV